MSSGKGGKYVALLGAYERDNFGDILFLLLTQRLIDPWVSVPLSIVSRNMEEEGIGSVYSLSAWFDCCGDYAPSAIIVVGGQVLHLPVERALFMDMPNEVAGKFLALDDLAKTQLSRRFCWRPGPNAYFPPDSLWKGCSNKQLRLIVNSVGSGGHSDSDSGALEDVLQRASFVSVRDSATKTLLESSIGPEVKLAPDVVSLFPSYFSDRIDEGAKALLESGSVPSTPYLLFQISSDYVRKISLAELADDLSRILIEYDLSIVLMPAGLAASHDSLNDLMRLKELLLSRVPESAIATVLNERDAILKVSAISMAQAVIGTSLHLRILATSFSKPRVSLHGEKVVRYCQTWEDGTQPFGVEVGSIFDAYTMAVGASQTILDKEAISIVEKARIGFEELKLSLPQICDVNDSSLAHDLVSDIAVRSLHRECEVYRAEMLQISSSLSKLGRDLARYESHPIVKFYGLVKRTAQKLLSKQ